MHSAISLVVGLGNPGAEYAATRHNAGVWLVDEWARRAGSAFTAEPKFGGELAKISVGGKSVWLFKPSSYMNVSGPPVQRVANFYKVPLEAILVVHDELELPPGEVRLKRGGGHAGHNGLRDLAKHVGADTWRLRLGIGRPEGKKMEVADYVLARPTRDERAWIDAAIDSALAAAPALVSGDFAAAAAALDPSSKSKRP
ncbi:MAG: aminoacyl-tRNA hydrolase [Thermoanaerobaculia bacterium]|nr:aminoacyl-tRNA hydrolase [Thermoanaerobaculia bacterium]